MTKPPDSASNVSVKLVTYNCKTIEAAKCAMKSLAEHSEIILVQEHWYFDCQLVSLEEVCETLMRADKGVDTGNPILLLQYQGALV